MTSFEQESNILMDDIDLTNEEAIRNADPKVIFRAYLAQKAKTDAVEARAEAAKAKTDIAEAIAEAAEAEAEAAKAITETAKAKADIAKAKADIAKARADIAETEAKTAKAKAETAKAKAEADASARIERAGRTLENLISSATCHMTTNGMAQLTVTNWNLNDDAFPNDLVAISSDLIAKIKEIVEVFQLHPKPTERSNSIEAPHSIHCLWKSIIEEIRKYPFGLPSSDRIRIGYEWTMPVTRKACNPNSTVALDFVFLDKKLPLVNFIVYAGGLECKLTQRITSSPFSSNNSRSASGSSTMVGSTAQGNLHREGWPLAIRRAASCVLARWNAAGNKGMHRSFCFFSDSVSLGVVRVTITEGCEVQVETLHPQSLPGINIETLTTPVAVPVVDGSSTLFLVLRLLAYVLHSPANSIAALATKPPPVQSLSLKGISPLTQTEVEWEPERVLGLGGFGMTLSCTNEVIKVGLNLQTEKQALDVLNDNNRNLAGRFPEVTEYLLEKPLSDNIVALKFRQRGIPLSRLIREIDKQPTRLAPYREQLLRHIGTNVIKALQDAHSAHVWHNDISRSNIIVVPTPSQFQIVIDIIDGGLDTMNQFLLESFDLAASRVILNDWGMSFVGNRAESNKSSVELKSAAEGVILGLFSPIAPDHFGIVKSEGSDMFSEEKRKDIIRLAEERKYDQIIQLLEGPLM